MEKQRRGTIAAETIGLCWESLQKKHKDIPKAVAVVIPCFQRRTGGIFTAARWISTGKHNISEIGISSILFSFPTSALSVILHECAHAILWKRGLPPVTGKGGYYHTKEFRNVCRDELSLDCEFLNTRYGWHNTYLSETDAQIYYKEELFILKSLPRGTGKYKGPPFPVKELPDSGYLHLSCKCIIPKRNIRCTPKVLELGGIRCEVCGSRFTPCSLP